MPPADIPSAVAVLLVAAGMLSPCLSFPRMATMESEAGAMPVCGKKKKKTSSTFHLDGSPLLTFDPFGHFFNQGYETGVRGEFNLTGQMEVFPNLLDLFLHNIKTDYQRFMLELLQYGCAIYQALKSKQF